MYACMSTQQGGRQDGEEEGYMNIDTGRGGQTGKPRVETPSNSHTKTLYTYTRPMISQGRFFSETHKIKLGGEKREPAYLLRNHPREFVIERVRQSSLRGSSIGLEKPLLDVLEKRIRDSSPERVVRHAQKGDALVYDDVVDVLILGVGHFAVARRQALQHALGSTGDGAAFLSMLGEDDCAPCDAGIEHATLTARRSAGRAAASSWARRR